MASFKNLISNTSAQISSGGTITGDLVINGDLQVDGGGSLSFDEIIEGTQVIDVTSTEALLVRKNGDGDDVFTVDTTNSKAIFGGNLELSASSPQINFSGTAGDYGTFGYTEGDPDVFKWGFFQNSGQIASITMDAVSEASPSARFRFNVGGDTDSALVIDSSKRIGIGGTPDTLLHLQGNNGNASHTLLKIHNNDVTSNTETGQTAEIEFSFQGTTDGGSNFVTKNAGKIVAGKESDYFTSSADNMDSFLAFYTSQDNTNTLAMHIDASQNVGIGVTPTNTSNYKTLDIRDSTGGQIILGRSGNADFFMYSASAKTVIGSGASAELAFHTNSDGASNERLRIDSNGRLGIGDSSPDFKLDVETTANSDVTVANFQSAIDANGEHSIIRVGNSGKGAFMGLLLNSSDTAYFGIDDNPDDGNGIYVNESGLIGIGSKAPSSKLTVVTTSDTNGTPTAYSNKFFTVGEGGTTGGNVFISYDQTNNRGYIGALTPGTAWRNLILNPGGGNIGIGSVNPVAKLVVSDGGNAGIELQPEIATDTNRITNYDRTASAYMNFRLDALTQQFLISGSEKMRLDSSGNLVVGQNSAQQKFEVHGGGIRIAGNITTPSSGVTGTLIDYFQSDARFWSRGADASTVGGFKFIGLENDGGNQSTQLEINSSGNATFSGDVITEGKYQISNTTPELLFAVPSGGLDSRIHNDGSGNLIFGTGTNSATPTERLRIDSSGDATFAGDVNIKSTGGNDDPATLALWSPDVSISADDTIGTILAQGSDSGGSPPYLGGKIEFNADANWDTNTPTYYPTRIDFFTQSNAGADATASPALTIDSSQNATFAGTINANAGINFPDTQVASSDVNTLDDYEEGTWTPVFTDGSNDFTMVANQNGRYTKIGRVVHFEAECGSSSIGSASGNLLLKGLPFTSANNTSESSCSIGFLRSFNYTSGGLELHAFVLGNTTTISFCVSRDDTTEVLAQCSDADSSAFFIRVSGTYFV